MAAAQREADLQLQLIEAEGRFVRWAASAASTAATTAAVEVLTAAARKAVEAEDAEAAAAEEARTLEHRLMSVSEAHANEISALQLELHKAVSRAGEAEARAAATAAAAAATIHPQSMPQTPPSSYGGMVATTTPMHSVGGVGEGESRELRALTGALTSVVDASLRRETEAGVLVALLRRACQENTTCVPNWWPPRL